MPLPPFESLSTNGTLLLNTSRAQPSADQWAAIYRNPFRYGLDRHQVLMAVPPPLRASVISLASPPSPLPGLALPVAIMLALSVLLAVLCRRWLTPPRSAVFTR